MLDRQPDTRRRGVDGPGIHLHRPAGQTGAAPGQGGEHGRPWGEDRASASSTTARSSRYCGAEGHDEIGRAPSGMPSSVQDGQSERLHAATGRLEVGDEDDGLDEPVGPDDPVTHGELRARSSRALECEMMTS